MSDLAAMVHIQVQLEARFLEDFLCRLGTVFVKQCFRDSGAAGPRQ